MDEESEIDRLRAENERLRAKRPKLGRRITTYFLKDGGMKFYMPEQVKYALPDGPEARHLREELERIYAMAEREGS